MKFELEYELASQRLKKIIRQYGCSILENPSRCHAFWGDLAPDLPEEGKVLDEFLAAGLGESAVELDEENSASCKEWKQRAVDTLLSRGMEQKDAVSLVEMVMYALGLEAEAVTNTASAAVKPMTESATAKTVTSFAGTSFIPEQSVTNPSPAAYNPPPAVETKYRKDFVNTLKQVQKQSERVEIDVEKRYELFRYYMPIIFPKRNYVSPTPLPANVTELLADKIGHEKLDNMTILAYGYDNIKARFFLFTDEQLVFRQLKAGEINHEILYNSITNISLTDGEFCVLVKTDGEIEELAFDFGGLDFYIADLLCRLIGMEKPEIYAANDASFIGNKLREYKTDAFGIYDKQKEISKKKLNNVCEELMKSHYKIGKEELEAIIDETVFGSCKEFIAFTSIGIFANVPGSGVQYIKYSDIVSMEAPEKGSGILIQRRDSPRDVCISHYGNREGLIRVILYIKGALGFI